MRKKHYKQMNQEDWSKLKGLLDYGVTLSQAVQVTGRSGQTLSMIKQSKSFEDYRELTKALWMKYKDPTGVRAKTVQLPIEGTPTIDDVYRELLEIKNILSKKRVLL